jgi:hypothetical protein
MRPWPATARGRLDAAIVAVVVIPVLTAAARRLDGDWVPIGDNALIEMRAHDVFSRTHFPFLGTWSSASLSAGIDLNHPGPLLFDLLAVPVRLFGGPFGVAAGIAAINVAAIVGIAVAVRHTAGSGAMLVALAAVALLVRALGSKMLTDPWNPHAVLLTSLAMFVFTWAVAAGRFEFAPWLVAAGSLCLQTHLGYAFIVPTCLAIAAAGGWWSHRAEVVAPTSSGGSEPSDDTPDPALERRRPLRWAAISILVGLLLWSQPIVEQFAGDGQGNLSRILGSSGGGEATTGVVLATRVVSQVVAGFTWARRSGFVDAIPFAAYGPDGRTVDPVGVRGPLVAALALIVVAGGLAALAVLGARRGRRSLSATTVTSARVTAVGPLVALVLIVVAVGSLSISPLGPLGLTPHQMRWLWSLAAFTAIVAGVALLDHATARTATNRDTPTRPIPGPPAPTQASTPTTPTIVAIVAIVIVAGASVPAYAQPAGPETAGETLAPSVALAGALDEVFPASGLDSPVVVRTDNLRFIEPYSTVVMAALQRAGIEFRVAESGWVRQLGDARAASGAESVRIEVWEARNAFDPPPGSTMLARVTPLATGDIDVLLAGEAEMVAWFGEHPRLLTDAGRAALDAGTYGADASMWFESSAEDFVGSGLAALLIGDDALIVDPLFAEAFRRTAALRNQVGITTVAVFAVPA